MRMFKGQSPPGLDEWHFPQASAFAVTGIRNKAVVAITCDREIITGNYVPT